jgi:subtilisin family serine protease
MTGGTARRAALGALGLLVLAPVLALAATGPNDPFFPQQWGLAGVTSSINAPTAWCASTGGALVADVDTGADFSHPDLNGRLVAGARFTSSDGSAGPAPKESLGDGIGHGTMTAGIIAADTNNGLGIAGIAPASQILVVKVFDDQGHGNTSDAASGIRWAVDNGARAINLSLGSDPTSPYGIQAGLVPDQSITSAIQYAASNNVAVAASAGNGVAVKQGGVGGVPASQYQPIANVALVVGALGPQAELAWYSNYGQGVNIYAPGGDDPNATRATNINIVSTYKGEGYAAGQGTSFAAPHVSGTLALLRSRGLSAAAARQQILNTAVTRGGLPDLDAGRALGATGSCSGSTGSGGGGASHGTGSHGGGPGGSGKGPGSSGSSSSSSLSTSPSSEVAQNQPGQSPSAGAVPPLATAPQSKPVSPGQWAIVAAVVLAVVGAGAGYYWYGSRRT